MTQASVSSTGRRRTSAPTVILWAGAAAAVPTMIRLALDHVVSDLTIFPAYFPFVLAAAAWRGWRTAAATTVLSALAANYFFMGAHFAFSSALVDVIGTAVFLVSAGFVIIGVERLKAAVRAGEAGRAAGEPPKGHGLLLAVALSLAAWAAMIWGGVHAIRTLT